MIEELSNSQSCPAMKQAVNELPVTKSIQGVTGWPLKSLPAADLIIFPSAKAPSTLSHHAFQWEMGWGQAQKSGPKPRFSCQPSQKMSGHLTVGPRSFQQQQKLTFLQGD